MPVMDPSVACILNRSGPQQHKKRWGGVGWGVVLIKAVEPIASLCVCVTLVILRSNRNQVLLLLAGEISAHV